MDVKLKPKISVESSTRFLSWPANLGISGGYGEIADILALCAALPVSAHDHEEFLTQAEIEALPVSAHDHEEFLTQAEIEALPVPDHAHPEYVVEHCASRFAHGISWSGGQTLPYGPMTAYLGDMIPILMVTIRSDGYVYLANLPSGLTVVVAAHSFHNYVPIFDYNSSIDRTSMTIPVGFNAFNTSGMSYVGFVFGIPA